MDNISNEDHIAAEQPQEYSEQITELLSGLFPDPDSDKPHLVSLDGVIDSSFWTTNGGSRLPNNSEADILKTLEEYEEPARYIDIYQKIGRGLPFLLMDEALSSYKKCLWSGNSSTDFDEFIESLVGLMDIHEEVYGSLFSDDMYDDLYGTSHLQPFITLYKQNGVKAISMPFMGYSALHFTLRRMSYLCIHPRGMTPSNTLVVDHLTCENKTTFFYTYVGFAELEYEGMFNEVRNNQIHSLKHRETVYTVDISEEYATYDNSYDDSYATELAAIHITLETSCHDVEQYPNVKSCVAEHPFKYMNDDWEGVSPMWFANLMSYYLDHRDFKEVAKIASKNQDVFGFWIACTSGLHIKHFKSFIGKKGVFSRLNKEAKINLIMTLAPLVDHIAINMQSEKYLNKSNLINMYP